MILMSMVCTNEHGTTKYIIIGDRVLGLLGGPRERAEPVHERQSLSFGFAFFAQVLLDGLQTRNENWVRWILKARKEHKRLVPSEYAFAKVCQE